MPQASLCAHRRFVCRLLLAFIIGIPDCTSAFPAVDEAATKPLKTFDLASDPSFRDYRQVVEAFAHRHRPKAVNDLCVVGYVTNDNLKNAWVTWRQGRKIILWAGQDDLDESTRRLNVKGDVVATEKDLHGSTFRVTKAWVQDINATCKRSGVDVHIAKEDISKQ